MAADRIRVGIIGLGAISFSHEAAYGEMEGSCQVVAMSDVREEEAASRSLLHGARTYTRYQELLDSSDVDMVDIIVPHHLHYEVALAAIQRGKHVLVEKPIAVNSWQGQQLIDAAQKAGVTLGVAENTRFVTAYQKAEEIVDAGWLGDILVVRTLIAGSEVHRIKDPGQWHGKLPYGGVILDSSVHNFYSVSYTHLTLPTILRV